MRAIIVDDEKHCRDVLLLLLEKYCPEVTVEAVCADGHAALEAIERLRPELLFLDVEMPGMDGFELLEACERPSFSIIFTTAYNQYAIQAIRHSALDYLLKPLDKDELIRAVEKAASQQLQFTSNKVNNLLLFLHEHLQAGERLALPTLEGLRMMLPKDIIFCVAEGAYTRLHLYGDKNTPLVCRTLKEVEAVLKDKGFFRVHHSYLINLSFMDKYIKGDGGEIIMTNGSCIPVSRHRKQDFMARIEKL
jgi:two-component system LytT family response regulator